MSLLISGICGFVGSSLARYLLESDPALQIYGLDNLARPGSQTNLAALKKLGIKVFHGDVRLESDTDALPPTNWVIDAAANPSVLAASDGFSTAKQVIETNLYGTVNLLEYARKHEAGFILLSSSRVYSIGELQKIPLKEDKETFSFDTRAESGSKAVSRAGLKESFSTQAPISLYGGTKLSSEILALEYANMYGMPLQINRCGVLAGAGQFGRPDQGILAYWINAYRLKRPLSYIGFGGSGLQVRDCFHPADLATFIEHRMNTSENDKPKIFNLGGGAQNAISLKQLSNWCADRFGAHKVSSIKDNRQLDVPWVIMDSELAREQWGFRITMPLAKILEEIAVHAENHPDWLELSAV
jgi:CDP-paratose 2-epimerase